MEFGYFDDASSEYGITDPRTPTKWINSIGTLEVGGFTDHTGGGLLIRPTHEGLELAAVLPTNQSGLSATRRFHGATYDITVTRPAVDSKRPVVDGENVPGRIVLEASAVAVELVIRAGMVSDAPE